MARSNDPDEPRKPSKPRKVSDLLPLLMARRGYTQILAADQFADAWAEACGRLQPLTRVGHYRRGVLEVVVASSLVLQELTFQKQQLLETLNRLLPDKKVRDVRFSVGSVD